MMNNDELVISQTKKWITDVVIGCNFCPFAAKEVKYDAIHYQVDATGDEAICLQALLDECIRLDEDASIKTTLLILPVGYDEFETYLDLVESAENLLEKHDYEGVYQVASFHPSYLFAGASEDDAANYTNRSVYPMLHLLREDDLEDVIERYPGVGKIPEDNIHFAREKGLQYMKLLRASCL